MLFYKTLWGNLGKQACRILFTPVFFEFKLCINILMKKYISWLTVRKNELDCDCKPEF